MATSKENKYVKDTIKITLSNQTGISFASDKGFKLFPNPATDYIKILTSVSQTEVVISDLLGHIVMQTKINSECNLKLSGLKSGIYIVRVKSGNKTNIVQLVKQ